MKRLHWIPVIVVWGFLSRPFTVLAACGGAGGCGQGSAASAAAGCDRKGACAKCSKGEPCDGKSCATNCCRKGTTGVCGNNAKSAATAGKARVAGRDGCASGCSTSTGCGNCGGGCGTSRTAVPTVASAVRQRQATYQQVSASGKSIATPSASSPGRNSGAVASSGCSGGCGNGGSCSGSGGCGGNSNTTQALGGSASSEPMIHCIDSEQVVIDFTGARPNGVRLFKTLLLGRTGAAKTTTVSSSNDSVTVRSPLPLHTKVLSADFSKTPGGVESKGNAQVVTFRVANLPAPTTPTANSLPSGGCGGSSGGCGGGGSPSTVRCDYQASMSDLSTALRWAEVNLKATPDVLRVGVKQDVRIAFWGRVRGNACARGVGFYIPNEIPGAKLSVKLISPDFIVHRVPPGVVLQRTITDREVGGELIVEITPQREGTLRWQQAFYLSVAPRQPMTQTAQVELAASPSATDAGRPKVETTSQTAAAYVGSLQFRVRK